MATTAQIKQIRQTQARKIRAAVRLLDTAQEKLQRKVQVLVGKRKMIEASDIPAVTTLYRDMVSKMNGIETEIINLANLTNN